MLAAVAVCREVELQRSVLTAQLSAQAASIQQEREALMSQRINTDMLASLSEQVGATFSTLCGDDGGWGLERLHGSI
jgi:hypothetical protein